ncbi:helix-turn-helix transcriptional regulator [Facilibium subflavum]|uniref:helix-turn-helix transcriptional regulator n=1 Tax=Facilibium subflavum TaxID=2219058 RepID=UPI0013C313E9|nr:LuxR C-terminal-related transcriptional regulator [Facilibium subflavum]
MVDNNIGGVILNQKILEKLLYPTKMYSNSIRKLNQRIENLDLILFQVNLRKKENTASVFYHLSAAEKFYTSRFFQEGMLRINYEELETGIYINNAYLGNNFCEVYLGIVEQECNLIICVRKYQQSKVIFVFGYHIKKSRNIEQAKDHVNIITEYILTCFNYDYDHIFNHLVDVKWLKPSGYLRNTFLSEERIFQVYKNFFNKNVCRLTKRQKLVATLIYFGKSIDEIANILGISKTTVVSYIEILRNKLNVNSKLGIANFIRENKFLIRDYGYTTEDADFDEHEKSVGKNKCSRSAISL